MDEREILAEGSPDELVPLRSPDGRMGKAPLRSVYGLTQRGYRYTPKAQRLKDQEREEYQSFANKGAAFLAAVPRGMLTGFVSDPLLTQTGAVDSETLRKLKEYNPGTTFAGEVAGSIGSFFVPGIKTIGPIALMMKAGGKAGKAAETLLKTNKIAIPSYLQKPLIGAATYGTEGLGYGVGSLVSENALGNAEFNAENLMSYMGTNAAFGAAFGGVLGLGKAYLSRGTSPKGPSGAEEPLILPPGPTGPKGQGGPSTDKFYPITLSQQQKNDAIVLGPISKAVDNFAGKPGGAFSRAAWNLYLKHAPIVSGVDRKLLEMFGAPFTKEGIASRRFIVNYEKNRDKFATNLEKEVKRTMKVAKDIESGTGQYRQAEREILASLVPPERAKFALDEVQDLFKSIRKTFERPENKGVYNRTLMHEFDKIQRAFNKEYKSLIPSNDPNKIYQQIEQNFALINQGKKPVNKQIDMSKFSYRAFNALDEAKRSLQKVAKYDAARLAPDAQITAKEIQKAAALIRETLERRDYWGALGKRQEKINKAYTNYIEAKKMFLKSFGSLNAKNRYEFDPLKLNKYVIRKDAQLNARDDARFDAYFQAVNDLAKVTTRPSKSLLELSSQFPSLEGIIKKQAPQYRHESILRAQQNKRYIDKNLKLIRAYRLIQWYGGRKTDVLDQNMLQFITDKLPIVNFFKDILYGGILDFRDPARTLRTLAYLESRHYKLEDTAQKNAKRFLTEKGFESSSTPPPPPPKGPKGGGSAAAEVPKSSGFTRSMQSIPKTEILFQSLLGIEDELMNEKGLQQKIKSKNSKKIDAMKQRQEEIGYLLNNPEALLDGVSANLGEIAQVMPETAIALSYKLTTALQYLESLIPKDPRDQVLAGIQRPFVPTDAQISRVEKAFQVFDNPLSVMDDVLRGTLTLETVNDLIVMYPELYAVITNSFVVALIEMPQQKITSAKSKVLSTLFQQPLTSTLQADLLNSIQATYTQGNLTSPEQASLTAPAKLRASQLAKSDQGKALSTDLNKTVGGV